MNANPASSASKIYARALLVAVLTTLLAIFVHAQADGTPPPPFNGIAHVAIRVHDLAASVAFYEKLGFEQAFDLRRDNVPSESFIKINDHQFIELYPVTAKDPTVGFLHLCFEGVDLNAIYDDYIGRGLTPTAVRKAGAGNLLFTMAVCSSPPARRTSSTPNTCPALSTRTTRANTSVPTASPTSSSP